MCLNYCPLLCGQDLCYILCSDLHTTPEMMLIGYFVRAFLVDGYRRVRDPWKAKRETGNLNFIRIYLTQYQKQGRVGDILIHVKLSKFHHEFCFESVMARTVHLVLNDQPWTGGPWREHEWVDGAQQQPLSSPVLTDIRINGERLQPGTQEIKHKSPQICGAWNRKEWH